MSNTKKVRAVTFPWYGWLMMLLAWPLGFTLTGYGVWLDNANVETDVERLGFVVFGVLVNAWGVAAMFAGAEKSARGERFWPAFAVLVSLGISAWSGGNTYTAMTLSQAATNEAGRSAAQGKVNIQDAITSAETRVETLQSDVTLLSENIADARKTRDAEARTGRGPNYRRASARIESLETELSNARPVLREAEAALAELKQRAVETEKRKVNVLAAEVLDPRFQEAKKWIMVVVLEVMTMWSAYIFGFRTGKASATVPALPVPSEQVITPADAARALRNHAIANKKANAKVEGKKKPLRKSAKVSTSVPISEGTSEDKPLDIGAKKPRRATSNSGVNPGGRGRSVVESIQDGMALRGKISDTNKS